MLSKHKLSTAIGIGVISASILSAGIAGATQGSNPAVLQVPPAPIETEGSDLEEAFSAEMEFLDEWQPSAEELAEINAEIAKEIKALTDAGVILTLETDEFGITYPVWNADQDDKAEAVYEELYGPFEDIDFEDADFEISPEEVAEINAEIAKEIKALTDAGVILTLETDEFGITYPVWNADQDDKAEAVYEELYGPFEDIDFEDADFDFDWEPTAEEITEIQALVDQEKAALSKAGIAFTLETDEFGLEYPVWNESEEDAAWDVLEGLWEDFTTEEVPNES